MMSMTVNILVFLVPIVGFFKKFLSMVLSIVVIALGQRNLKIISGTKGGK